MLTTPKGIRLHNPLNLMRTAPRQDWAGAVADSALEDGREEQFITDFWGLRAAAIVLVRDEEVHGRFSCEAIFTSFAPPVENDTGAYIRNMADGLGVKPDDHLNLRDPATMLKLLKLATRQEDGEQPYPDELINEAIGAALKSVPPAQPTST